jgi:hypothetical protein
MQAGKRRPETFAFLGFTHYCGWTRDRRSVVKRKTKGRRITRKLKELRQEAQRRMHKPVAKRHHWLVGVLRGYCAYYGLPACFHSMAGFYHVVKRLWCRSLRLRGQRRRLSWSRFNELQRMFPLPQPRILPSLNAARTGMLG